MYSCIPVCGVSVDDSIDGDTLTERKKKQKSDDSPTGYSPFPCGWGSTLALSAGSDRDPDVSGSV